MTRESNSSASFEAGDFCLYAFGKKKQIQGRGGSCKGIGQSTWSGSSKISQGFGG